MVSIAINEGRKNVAMLGIGAYRPKRVVSNADVCEVLDSTPEWIFERTGIRNRRWISGDETLRSMSAAAGERAVINSGIDRSKISALILATSSWLKLTPHGAPSVAFDLGMNGIPAFDLTSGCGGFGYALGVAADLIRAGSAEYVLVIGAETMTVGLDPTDRGTAMIFGDGAGAVVVGPSDVNGISPTVWGSDGESAEAISQDVNFFDYMDRAERLQGTDPEVEPVGRMALRMEGPRVFRWAAVTLPRALSTALEVSGVAKEDIEVFVPHQANARINELMKKNLGLADDIPMANDIENTGNTSAASIPLAMEEMLVTGKAKGGQLALLLGFGAGLSYAGQVVTLPPKPIEPSF
ncbi:3-oxoacyl-ACP synthase [Nocardia sp. 852002-20019_SCH5090214]|uniref:Ketoacyl-ACP synthase III n=3 Tax=Nocardia TaxID=1817 RepID=A0A2S5ZWA8_9NOCA|nr:MULTISPECIES: beta-ketoacyl-ACP synthase III [Nocardia]OBF63145.1 3-oxoacyl-ACP synthase [Mycobacterium sp. 852002-51759_SCH5129042]MBF6245108.1 ketoacyl-ACP synthase III [Nocardia elegans]MBF6272570.1 ketoacyl-ACP synthase III [Nocardia nova]MBF6450012.1 ketoacyl-ACP synthase III [Nocardia elegans]MBV7701254.1 ketoacyl-ACP synthase III [Nocardia nova]